MVSESKTQACAGLPPTTATRNLKDLIPAYVHFIDASQRMELFYVQLLVCVDVAWLILMLQINALSHNF